MSAGARSGPDEGVGVVGVVGLGLMGGSLARDLTRAGVRVLGADQDASALDRALSQGAVAGPLDLAALDLLVLAVPVMAAPGWLRRIGPELRPDAVVTDVGSTKRSIVEAAGATGLATRFVGSHPMAGDHRSGFDASRPGLFRDARVWVCAGPDTTPAARRRVESLWRLVGADPRAMDPTEHDRAMARISHAPQVTATALAVVLARAGVGPERLGPGGRDTTRLAASDPAMWADILVDNGDQVVPVLAELVSELERMLRAVRGLDHATLRSLLTAARAWSRGEPEPEVEALRTDVA